MIPKRVHLFWQSPSGENGSLPPDMQHHVDQWRHFHPDFDVRVWSPKDLYDVFVKIQGLPIWQLMHACRFEAMKSDLARLALVYELGGFYTDLKNLPLRRFLDELIDDESALIAEHPPTVEVYEGRPSNSFLGAPPHHVFFQSYLKLVCENISNRLQGGVVDVTGNVALKRAILRFERTVAGGNLKMIPSIVAWGAKGGQGGWLRRTSASYNQPNMKAHWSVRQKTETLYNEEKVVSLVQ